MTKPKKHGGEPPHLEVDEPGERRHAEDNQQRVEIDHPFLGDLQAPGQVPGEHELRQVPGQRGAVHPIDDEIGQQVPELHEHGPKDRGDEHEGQQPDVPQVPRRGGHYLPDPAGAVGSGVKFPIGGQPQEVQADQDGAAVKDRGPGVAVKEMGQRRSQEAADIDHQVEKAPAHPGGLLRQGLGKGPLDRRLEDGGARGQDQAAGQERAKLPLAGHHQVAQDLQADGHHDLALVAVAVGEAAGEHRQGRLHQGPPQEDEALVALAEVQAADLIGLGDVDGDDHPHPVVGQALDHLHEVGRPERPGQAAGLLPE